MSILRKRRSTGKVTIADVAQLAGVGTMTVSRALRTPEQVSDKLREKSKRQCMSWAICLISPPARWRLPPRTPSQWSYRTLRKRGVLNVRRAAQFYSPQATRLCWRNRSIAWNRGEAARTLLASNIAAAILLSVEHSTTVRQWLKMPLSR